MLECLQNRIELKGCADEEDVQLFINSLPGISMENVKALVDDEQKLVKALWEDVVLRTLKKLELLIKAELNKCYQIKDKAVIQCIICENVEAFDVASWYLHGVELMIERTSTDRLNRFTTVDFDKAERLKEDFYVEFTRALKDAVESIDPTDGDCMKCVECNDTYKWVEQTP